MKAITICQPYAHLICLPESHPDHKRVENRSWPTRYRGPLLIHAGKSKEWLSLDVDELVDEEYGIRITDMRFGAVVAEATLADCISYKGTQSGLYSNTYPWLKHHQHTEGPWCWILKDVMPLPAPFAWRGAQGLWEIPDLEYIAATERWPADQRPEATR